MEYIIKVKGQYVAYVGLWTKFTWFKESAQRFEDREDAEAAVEDLFAYGTWRNFDRGDVTIIPYEA